MKMTMIRWRLILMLSIFAAMIVGCVLSGESVRAPHRDGIKTFTVHGASFRMLRIPGGEYKMGSPSNEPGRKWYERQHNVSLSGFWIGETEVTQTLWTAVMGGNPSHFSGCGACPVDSVSWEDAQVFIRKLNQAVGGERFRLPTEAEWEYAARSGTTTPFAFGECLSADQANYDGNYPMPGCPKGPYRKKPTPVKHFDPNAWGLYDMHGNVWEWCKDWFGEYPLGSAADPKGPSSGTGRVIRGGSWLMYVQGCRSANRYKYSPDGRLRYLGFRLAMPD